jgi:hypothetical protein
MILLIQLFLAHILGDFFLQPSTWVEDKKIKKLRSIYLYLHILIHFMLILVIVGNIDFWKPALLIALLHFFIDSSKLLVQKAHTERTWFFVDQVLHLATLLIIWSYKQSMVIDFHALYDKKVLIPVTAVLFVLNPTSFIIKTVISKWTPNPAPAGSAPVDESLENAGKLIGMMERLMVLVFVSLGKWEGVGFLLAAKSVFRFGDLKDAKNMKLTEYVLIGTLLSFGLAVFAGLAAIKLLG